MATNNRGFASMNKDKQRAIAASGGRAAHAKGTAHTWTSAEAAEAGRKGGRATHSKALVKGLLRRGIAAVNADDSADRALFEGAGNVLNGEVING